LFGKLAGTFVQLRGHLGGFPDGTTEASEDLGKFRNFHNGRDAALRRPVGAARRPYHNCFMQRERF